MATTFIYNYKKKEGDCIQIETTNKATRAAFYNSQEWKEKRWQILERDNFECQWCKEEGKVTIGNKTKKDKEEKELETLEVDHIKELADHPELALDNDNLRTLCKDCHNKRHRRMNYRSRNKNAKKGKWIDDERWD